MEKVLEMYDTLRGLWNSFIIVYSDFPLACGLGVAFLSFIVSVVFVMREKKKASLVFDWKEWLQIIIFSLYMVLLLGGTLLCRDVGEVRQVELRLFWSYWETFVKHNQAIWQQMLYNVLVFVPWGMLLLSLFRVKRRSWIIGSAAICSFVIEFIQLVLKLGLFELDDIFHNTVGAVIGYGIWVGWQKIKKMELIRC